MSKKPSITVTESLRPNRACTRALVQRSNTRITATSRIYGKRPCSFDGMKAKYSIRGRKSRFRVVGKYGILNVHFSNRGLDKTGL